MKRILKEFFKASAGSVVFYTIVCAAIIGAFFLTGIFAAEKTYNAGLLASGFIVLSDLIMLVQLFIIAPCRLRSQLAKLSQDEQTAVTEGFESAQKIGSRYFMQDIAVVFSYRRIYLIRYTDIRTIERGQRNLFLTMTSGKSIVIEFGYNEDLGQTLAAFMLKNPDIRLLNPNSQDKEITDKGKET
ncbi:MAG: hypothetical protein ACI4KM_03665 [Oscillospiraceae bacterium]